MHTQKDDPLLRRINDLCSDAGNGSVRFTAFLDERQQLLAETMLSRRADVNFILFGGFDGAARRVIGIFPEYDSPREDEFPIEAIAARHGRGERLEHRAVLGSLIALGIARESIGDILPEDGICRFVVLKPVAGVVRDELCRIGRTGVRCNTEDFATLAPTLEFENLRGTVSSPRIDSLVRLLTNLSRERSAELVRGGLVQKSYVQINSPDEQFAPGDIITIRGYGKYIVDEIGSPTRKSRLPVICRKYK